MGRNITIESQEHWDRQGLKMFLDANEEDHFFTPPGLDFVFDSRTDDFTVTMLGKGIQSKYYRQGASKSSPVNLYLGYDMLTGRREAGRGGYYDFTTVSGPERATYTIGLGESALKLVAIKPVEPSRLSPGTFFRDMLKGAF